MFAGLVAVTAAAVLALTWGASLRNTVDSLNQRAVDLTSALQTGIERHLLPAEDMARETVNAIREGIIDPRDQNAFAKFLMGGLAATPQIRALAVIRPDYTSWSVHRAEGPLQLETVSRAPPEVIAKAFKDAKSRKAGPYWGDLVRVRGATLINLRTLFDWPGGGQGMLVAAISTQELSRFLMVESRYTDWTGFILYNRSEVLAHPMLNTMPKALADVLTEDQPLLPLSMLPDPVLRGVWEGTDGNIFRSAAAAGAQVRLNPPDDPTHIFVIGRTTRFGDTPWYFGAYTDLEAVDSEYDRAIGSGAASLVLVGIAIIAAIWIGQRLSRPLQRTAIAAGQIGRLELDVLTPLPKSRVREFDQQANAFNQMAEGLRTFSTYVPKQLVALLASRGFRADIPAQSMEVTVLFTDIVGFTSQTERMSAEETATMLNEHFTLLGQAIHEEEGVIDKYIGDSVMAFWVPALSGEEAAAHAVRCARRMATLLKEDNRNRVANHQQPVRVRVGIHTGTALVGNIGASDRVNFTVVGDTVNVAQRLQEYGRNVDPSAECIILASDATIEAIPADERGECIGALPIRGRSADIVGWRL